MYDIPLGLNGFVANLRKTTETVIPPYICGCPCPAAGQPAGTYGAGASLGPKAIPRSFAISFFGLKMIIVFS